MNEETRRGRKEGRKEGKGREKRLKGREGEGMEGVKEGVDGIIVNRKKEVKRVATLRGEKRRKLPLLGGKTGNKTKENNGKGLKRNKQYNKKKTRAKNG